MCFNDLHTILVPISTSANFLWTKWSLYIFNCLWLKKKWKKGRRFLYLRVAEMSLPRALIYLFNFFPEIFVHGDRFCLFMIMSVWIRRHLDFFYGTKVGFFSMALSFNWGENTHRYKRGMLAYQWRYCEDLKHYVNCYQIKIGNNNKISRGVGRYLLPPYYQCEIGKEMRFFLSLSLRI